MGLWPCAQPPPLPPLLGLSAALEGVNSHQNVCACVSTGDTFFLRADDTPSSRLEHIARAVFDFHSRNAKFDPSKSGRWGGVCGCKVYAGMRVLTRPAGVVYTVAGAEWWVQVLEEDDDIGKHPLRVWPLPPRNGHMTCPPPTINPPHLATSPSPGLHFDKDYMIEQQGYNLHPHVATVTYLTDGGGPTLILPLAGPLVHGTDLTCQLASACFSFPEAGGCAGMGRDGPSSFHAACTNTTSHRRPWHVQSRI